MLRLALGLGRRFGELRSLAVPTVEATQAYAGNLFSTSTASHAKGAEFEFDVKDVDSSFARMLMAEAEADKKKDAMTKDINKIIEWLEDATPSDDKGYEGKLKDILPSFDKNELNEVCKEIPQSTEMANMHPALKNLINDLGAIGDAGRIVDIAYKYAELLDPKATESKGLNVELVLPAKESAAEVEDKKNMLIQDMLKRKRIDAKTPIAWKITVDPSILGGCIYRLGDVELDCSRKSLEDEFFAALDKEGIKRIA